MFVEAQARAVGDVGAAVHADRDVANFGLVDRKRAQDAEKGHRAGEVGEEVEVEPRPTDRPDDPADFDFAIILAQLFGDCGKAFGNIGFEIIVEIDQFGDHHHDAVAIAQILDIAAGVHEREKIFGIAVERGQEALVNDGEMIGVGRILELDFPVAGKGEAMFAHRLDGETAALFHEQVDPRLGAPKEAVERFDLFVEGREDQAVIFFDAQLDQAIIGLVEILIALGQRQAAQLAVLRIGPRMIGADEARGIALARFAHRRAAVAAAVDHDMNFARLGAVHDDRLAPDMGGDEIAGFGNVADVRDPDPGAVEDAVHLLLEDRRIAIERGVDAVGKDQRVKITCSHLLSPLLARSGTGMSAVSFQ